MLLARREKKVLSKSTARGNITTFVTIQPMPLRVRKPLSGVILRSKIGVETITIHPKIDIPDKGMSRKTFSDILLCAKHILKHRHSPLRVNS